ncbi:MAG: DMT family transporter [Pseudomonadota bacterium]
MQNQGKAYLYGLGTVLLWSTVASAFKLSLEHLNHVQLLFYSSLFSSAALALLLGIQGRLRLIFSYSRRQNLQSVWLGFLNPFLYYLVLFKAYDLLPAQEAQALNYTWAMAMALLSIPLLGQKIGRQDLAAILVSYAGVVVISTRGDVFSWNFSNKFGAALALGSTVIWALYWIFNTKDARDPAVGLLLNFLCGLPFILIYGVLFSDLWPVNGPGIVGAAYVGFFEMGLTFALWLSALKYSENTAKVGNLIFLSPFLSLVLIHYFVGEEILPSTFVGLSLIIMGQAVQRIRRRRA